MYVLKFIFLIVPVISLLPLSFKFILYCLTLQSRNHPVTISHFQQAQPFSYDNRGQWRDIVRERSFCSSL